MCGFFRKSKNVLNLRLSFLGYEELFESVIMFNPLAEKHVNLKQTWGFSHLDDQGKLTGGCPDGLHIINGAINLDENSLYVHYDGRIIDLMTNKKGIFLGRKVSEKFYPVKIPIPIYDLEYLYNTFPNGNTRTKICWLEDTLRCLINKVETDPNIKSDEDKLKFLEAKYNNFLKNIRLEDFIIKKV